MLFMDSMPLLVIIVGLPKNPFVVYVEMNEGGVTTMISIHAREDLSAILLLGCLYAVALYDLFQIHSHWPAYHYITQSVRRYTAADGFSLISESFSFSFEQ